MSDDKSKVTDKASEIAKNIWLAGVGAYGRAVDEAQDRLEKAGVETPKLFKDLVKAGAALEEEAQKDPATSSARKSVEDRINKVRENFHNQRLARIEDLSDLEAKVEIISRKLDLLAQAMTDAGLIDDPPKVKKAAARRKSAARKTSARKTPAKKAAAKKPAARAGKAPAKKATRSSGGRGKR